MLAMFWEIARWRAARPATALRRATLVTSSNKKAPPKEWPAGAGQVRWPIRGREGGRSLPTEFFVTRPAYLSGDFARSRRPDDNALVHGTVVQIEFRRRFRAQVREGGGEGGWRRGWVAASRSHRYRRGGDEAVVRAAEPSPRRR